MFKLIAELKQIRARTGFGFLEPHKKRRGAPHMRDTPTFLFLN